MHLELESLNNFNRPLARLIDQLERLPGIGPRTAQRLALHLIRQPKEYIQGLMKALEDAHTQVGHCQVCFHLSVDTLCDICHSKSRNGKILCIVADSRDVLALERTREYEGRYHVLGGLISPLDGVGPELLQIKTLLNRLNENTIDEVILALPPSIEGDTTSLYLARLLKPITQVSRIAYGLPVGSELEYVDAVTLSRALEGRQILE